MFHAVKKLIMPQKPQNAAFATNEQMVNPAEEIGTLQYQQRGPACRRIVETAAYSSFQL
jgi:hypothetical protein